MNPSAILRLLVRLRIFYRLASGGYKLTTAARNLPSDYANSPGEKEVEQLFTVPQVHKTSDDLFTYYFLSLFWYHLASVHDQVQARNAVVTNNILNLYIIPSLRAAKVMMKGRPKDASPSETYSYMLRAIKYAYMQHMSPRWDHELYAFTVPGFFHPPLSYYFQTYSPALLDSQHWRTTLVELTGMSPQEVDVELAMITQLALSKVEADAYIRDAKGARVQFSVYLPTALYFESAGAIDKTSISTASLRIGSSFIVAPGFINAGPSSFAGSRADITIGKFTPTIRLGVKVFPEIEEEEQMNRERMVNLPETRRTIKEAAELTGSGKQKPK